METLVSIYANSPKVPHNDEHAEIISLNIAFITVSASIVFLRIVVRTLIVKHVALDDYLMIAAGSIAAAFSAMCIAGTQWGLGRHVWDLNPNTLISDVKKAIQTLWVCQVLYTTALALVKMSIIASFHRIFPTKSIRWTLYVLAGLITAVWIIGIFTTIFQCSPIYAAWDFTIVSPKCIPIMKVYYFTTAFSIVTDLILCILPIPFFWKLKLPLKEKWIVSGLFAFGLFAAVASIMRITVLHEVQSADFTSGAVPTLNWSVVEVGTGIICACVPCLKPLFKKLLPGKFFSTAPRSRPKSYARNRESRPPRVAEDTEMMTVVRHDSEVTKDGSMKPPQGTTVNTREFV